MYTKEVFDRVPKFASFKYWFIRRPNKEFDIYKKEDEQWTKLTTLSQLDKIEAADNSTGLTGTDLYVRLHLDEIYEEINRFKLRPEYIVGAEVNITDNTADDLQTIYENLLVGCAFIRAAREFKRDPDTVWEHIDRCLMWLRRTDFFSCPASTQYHDSQPRGLLYHTLKVVNRVVELLSSVSFSNVDVASAVLVALVHDWCKIGLYESYTRNVKDETTGAWRVVPAYKYAENRSVCLGHGVSSMYLASKFFNLSIDEAAAIRYHMGRWNCVDAEVNELQQANRTYPLVHLLQFADQLAIVNY